MSGAADRSRTRQQHADQWVMVDARLQLLAVGSALYNGTSPRNALDITARHILVPRLRAAAGSGRELAETALFDDVAWQVQVIPILGPVSRQPLAVLGCYGHDATQFPEPPLVGSWEWRVTPPGPEQEMRTFWSDALFDVYGMPKPNQGHAETAYWEGPQWLDELIASDDRAEIRKLLDEFLNTNSDALFLHTYRVRNPTTSEHHKLRFAGRSYVTEPGPPRWFRGISTRIDHLRPPEDGPSSTQEFLNAAFALTPEPLCAIDAIYEQIYITTENFTQLRVELPAHRHLPEMCHPADLPRLRDFLHDAASGSATPGDPVRVRFRTEEGSWRTLTITGTGVRLTPSSDPHHVLCRVTLADP